MENLPEVAPVPGTRLPAWAGRWWAGRWWAGRWWVGLLACYAASRLLMAAAIGVTSVLPLRGARCGSAVPVPIRGYAGVSMCWDTIWFMRTARDGYPAEIDPAHPQSTLAFFPGYPGLIAAVHALGVPLLLAAIALAVVLGGAATLLVRQLGMALHPDRPDAAAFGAMLFCFFPGALVLSFGYSEALGAVAAAGCLLLLHRQSWWAAGLAGTVASATRADLCLALLAAAVVAAVQALRRERAPGPLAAVLLTPLGAVGFFGFLWWHTGSPLVWSRTQRLGWGQHVDWGTHAVKTIGRLASDPFRSASAVTQLVALALLAGGIGCVVVLARRERGTGLPLPWLAYSAVLVLLMVLSNQVGFRVRAELLILPCFVAAGQVVRRPAGSWLLPLLAAGQALLTVAYLGSDLIVPP